MDWNDTLFWLVGLSAALLAARVLARRPRPRGWIAVLLLIGAVLALGRWFLPGGVGYLGLALWLLLVVVPSVGQRHALRLAGTRHTRAARGLAALSVWLHPADGWRETRAFITALAALQHGRAADAEAILLRLRGSGGSIGRAAVALMLRQSGEWPAFQYWVDLHPQRDDVLADPLLLDAYLQSLGETGQRERMLLEFSQRAEAREQAPAQVHIAALCGDVATVRRLLAGPLRSWPADVAEFWVATARQASGDDAATPILERLAGSQNLLVARPARRRLGAPLPPLDPLQLDPASRQALTSLHQDAVHESHFAVLSSIPNRPPIVTVILAVLLTANFLRELPGGSENQQNLIDLGAIVIPRHPPRFAPWLPSYDEWWRPITAAFLHFGWLHFLMNLGGLLYLGIRLERAWGPLRTLICYAAAVGVSMTLTPWLLEQSLTEPQILAGASGGIMGLLGGLLGHLLVGRMRRRTPLVSRQLSLLLALVLLQSLFDLAHVQVSQQAHLLGLGTGALLGLIFGALPLRTEPAGAAGTHPQLR
jgi:rhomboid protease GluP